MKDLFLNSSINYIKKYNDYSDTKIKQLKYGLEAIYLTVTKFIFILILSLILGITKEMLIYSLIYNIIRITSRRA